jgi:hypothetical protein
VRTNTLLIQGISADFKAQHRARWFAYSGAYGELLPLVTGQRLYGIGYEVKCACGWKTKTGGAIKASVKDDHAGHIYDEYCKVEGH